MLTQQDIKRYFDYDAEGGYLVWSLDRDGSLRGKIAGTTESSGRRIIKYRYKNYAEHILIWVLHHGYYPRYIYHINKNLSDNRIENLRAIGIKPQPQPKEIHV